MECCEMVHIDSDGYMGVYDTWTWRGDKCKKGTLIEGCNHSKKERVHSRRYGCFWSMRFITLVSISCLSTTMFQHTMSVGLITLGPFRIHPQAYSSNPILVSNRASRLYLPSSTRSGSVWSYIFAVRYFACMFRPTELHFLLYVVI